MTKKLISSIAPLSFLILMLSFATVSYADDPNHEAQFCEQPGVECLHNDVNIGKVGDNVDKNAKG